MIVPFFIFYDEVDLSESSTLALMERLFRVEAKD